MIEIYHVPGTRSVRVLWVCEELEQPYEAHLVDFSPEYRATPEWRALNPVGKVPVMRDGDVTIFESGAMVEHLLDRYVEGRLRPAPGSSERAYYRQWCWFAEATFARPLGEIVNHQRVFPEGERSVAALDEMAARALLCLDALEPLLAKQEYLLASGFSAADIMMGYSLLLTRRFDLLTDRHPAVLAYYERLKRSESFVKAAAGSPGF